MSAEEKALEQTLSDQEPIAEGQTEISQGHVDMGPKYVNGEWTLMFHDDHEDNPVWRRPTDVVLKSDDSALLPKPDDERYNFVRAEPGDQVYVIPQTELSGVVWPGWNTQDPEVVSKLGRGVTLTLDKVEGPGQFSLYLENGNFSAPQVLWNSDTKDPQDLWVEPNTHTHANWVFTQPGAYFLTVTAHAELADGSTVSNTQRLQFAVGSDTTSEQVFAEAKNKGEAPSSDQSSQNSPVSDTSSQDDAADTHEKSSASVLPWIVGGLVLLVLISGGAFAILKKRDDSAQQRAKDLLR